ncbi:MAG TPA: Spx/MgsR family RNA polymerase-binding regulatory protein [Methanocorpusculum sp.]|nr:Spx/MgsR family RNA polymerase-binding regulatory protein [Methanocorpusculum sp.]
MLLLWYPKCTTCQKAHKFLEENGADFEERDIKEQNPADTELRTWHKTSGLPLKKFFNTSGLLYKELNLKEKLLELTEDEQFALLASNRMLVKRPLLIGKDFVLIGFKQTEWEKHLK